MQGKSLQQKNGLVHVRGPAAAEADEVSPAVEEGHGSDVVGKSHRLQQFEESCEFQIRLFTKHTVYRSSQGWEIGQIC